MLYRQRGEVHLQHVRFHHRQARPLAQPRRQVAVQLDDGERTTALQQRLRQSAQARPDLHQRLSGPGCDRPHDAVDDCNIDEEVLAEALARDMGAQAWAQNGGSRNST